MAHEYLLRAFLTFSLMLLVNIGWYLAGLINQAWWPESGPKLTTPRQAIAAVAEVESLASQLKSEAAWTVLDRDCRRRSAGRAALTIAPDPSAAVAKIPGILRPAGGETGAAQNIRLDCAGRAVGRIRVWFIPARVERLKRISGLPYLLAVPAIDNVAGLTKNWPPTDVKADPAKLPSTLIQQAALRRDGTGRPIALAITAIGPSVLKAP